MGSHTSALLSSSFIVQSDKIIQQNKATPVNITILGKFSWLILLSYIALLPTKSFYNIPIIILAVAGIALIYLYRDSYYENDNIKRFGLIFLCIWIPMILSLPDAVNFQESFRKVLSFAAYYLMGVAVISLLTDETRKQYFINGTGVLLFFWCLDASWQSYAGSNLFGFPYDNDKLSGIFYPKLRLGLILAILSPFYFEFIRHYAKKYAWATLLLIPYIYVIILSGSKSSWVMLSISIFLYVVFLFLSGFFSRLTKTHVIITVVICFVGVALLTNTGKIIPENKAVWIEDRMHSIVSLLSGDIDNAGQSFQERIKIWEGAIRVARDHWINGVGPRGFRYIVDDYIAIDDEYFISVVARRATHPHQIVLEIMTETGIIGVIGYLLFFTLILKEAMRLIRVKNYDALPWVFPVIIAVFPINMYKAFYGHYTATLIWVLIALSFASKTREHGHS